MRDKQEFFLVSLIGIIPVTWAGLLVAPYIENSLFDIVVHSEEILRSPFHIQIVPGSVKTVLLFLLLYGMGIGIYLSMRGNYRRGEEHGSARWGDARTVNKKYAKKPYADNKLLTQNVRIGYDGRKAQTKSEYVGHR